MRRMYVLHVQELRAGDVMTIRKVEVHQVRCDANLATNCTYATAYDSETEAIAQERALASGWFRDADGKHVCCECQLAFAAKIGR